MGKSGQVIPKFGELSPQVLAERTARFLRGRYPHKTADYVACDMGISTSTVRKWLEQTSAPSMTHCGLMFYAYGPAFLAAVWPGLPWVDTLLALSSREAAERQIAEAEAALSSLRVRR